MPHAGQHPLLIPYGTAHSFVFANVYNRKYLRQSAQAPIVCLAYHPTDDRAGEGAHHAVEHRMSVEHTARTAPAAGDRLRPSRVVVIQGQSFSVQEEPCSHAGHTESSLVFSSERVARRVRSYPPDWYSLPDEALAQLSWSR